MRFRIVHVLRQRKKIPQGLNFYSAASIYHFVTVTTTADSKLWAFVGKLAGSSIHYLDLSFFYGNIAPGPTTGSSLTTAFFELTFASPGGNHSSEMELANRRGSSL